VVCEGGLAVVIVAVCKCVFPMNNERSEHVVLYTHSRKRKNRKKRDLAERRARGDISCRQEERREGEAHRTTWTEIDLVDEGSL